MFDMIFDMAFFQNENSLRLDIEFTLVSSSAYRRNFSKLLPHSICIREQQTLTADPLMIFLRTFCLILNLKKTGIESPDRWIICNYANVMLQTVIDASFLSSFSSWHWSWKRHSSISLFSQLCSLQFTFKSTMQTGVSRRLWSWGYSTLSLFSETRRKSYDDWDGEESYIRRWWSWGCQTRRRCQFR